MVKVYGAGALGFGFRIWVLEQNLGGKLSRGVCKGHLYYLGLGPRAQHGLTNFKRVVGAGYRNFQGQTLSLSLASKRPKRKGVLTYMHGDMPDQRNEGPHSVLPNSWRIAWKSLFMTLCLESGSTAEKTLRPDPS